MLQVTLEEPGRFVTGTGQDPRREEDEALVRIQRIGVCGSDLHAFRGEQPYFTYPRILGHELSGEIAEIGPNDRGLAVGDRVAIEPYVSCGHCRACLAGRYNCCARLEVMGVHRDGGMREWLSVPLHLLHKSERLTLEQLALVETLGIGYHAVEQGAPTTGEWAVIVGAGPIGLAVLQFALLSGASVAILDTNPARLEFAKRLGAEHTIDARGDAVADVAELAGPDLGHLVFEATGSLASMGNSLRFAGPGGRLVMVGLGQGSFAVDDPLFHRRELTLIATRNSARAFPPIIRLLEEGRIDTTPWITHHLDLAALPEQFPRLYDPDAGVVKAMIAVRG